VYVEDVEGVLHGSRESHLVDWRHAKGKWALQIHGRLEWSFSLRWIRRVEEGERERERGGRGSG
jgi:hypothetical protein